jgi:pSer/pThr/pTyr-binding forkhead associated (FHA) protein
MNAPLRGIRGTGGQFNANTFEVGDRILIGRDSARCAIVFEPQAQGVSSLHCEILRVNDSLKIIDHNSTYGTFLSGAKLQPNIPIELKAGSRFYLGDQRNSFTVY